MRDGGLNGISSESGFFCFTVFISTTAACKSGQQLSPLMRLEFRKPFIIDSNTSKESPPSIKAPSLLLQGLGCDSVVLVVYCPSEDSHEVIVFGSGDILKFFGVCSE